VAIVESGNLRWAPSSIPRTAREMLRSVACLEKPRLRAPRASLLERSTTEVGWVMGLPA
jgi:hypothetical protein